MRCFYMFLEDFIVNIVRCPLVQVILVEKATKPHYRGGSAAAGRSLQRLGVGAREGRQYQPKSTMAIVFNQWWRVHFRPYGKGHKRSSGRIPAANTHACTNQSAPFTSDGCGSTFVNDHVLALHGRGGIHSRLPNRVKYQMSPSLAVRLSI